MNKTRNMGGWGWIGQAGTGLLLLFLLGLHMVAHHFVAQGGLRTYLDVLSYVRNPFIVGWEATFLIVVTYHALAGLRAVLLDLGLNDTQERRLTYALAGLGAIIVVYGLWLVAYLASQAVEVSPPA